MSDRGVNLVLATYGKIFPITRQAIINDDLGAFTKVPAKMGTAAKRTIGNLVYAILTSNAARRTASRCSTPPQEPADRRRLGAVGDLARCRPHR
jgi:phage major head subunit gpT-like protein